MVEALLVTGKVKPDSKNSFEGRTPLSETAERGYTAVVEALLATVKVKPDSKDMYKGRTPLWWAAALGRTAVVELLRPYKRP